MICRVQFTRRAEKQVRRLPGRVVRKLKTWTYLVRLSRAYRAIYEVVPQQGVEVVSVEEVSKHGY